MNIQKNTNLHIFQRFWRFFNIFSRSFRRVNFSSSSFWTWIFAFCRDFYCDCNCVSKCSWNDRWFFFKHAFLCRLCLHSCTCHFDRIFFWSVFDFWFASEIEKRFLNCFICWDYVDWVYFLFHYFWFCPIDRQNSKTF